MIKAALACTLLLAVICSVLAANIECYDCYQGPSKYKDEKRATCLDPLDKSKKEKADTSVRSCGKLVVDIKYEKEKSAKIISRTAINKNGCEEWSNKYKVDLKKFDPDIKDVTIKCYECSENLCDLASTARISFLLLLAPVLAYLMGS